MNQILIGEAGIVRRSSWLFWDYLLALASGRMPRSRLHLVSPRLGGSWTSGSRFKKDFEIFNHGETPVSGTPNDGCQPWNDPLQRTAGLAETLLCPGRLQPTSNCPSAAESHRSMREQASAQGMSKFRARTYACLQLITALSFFGCLCFRKQPTAQTGRRRAQPERPGVTQRADALETDQQKHG